MMELIPKIQQVWNTKRDEVLESAKRVMNALELTEERKAGRDLGAEVLSQGYGELAGRFDKKRGGFSQAPKFPTPHNFYFMLRYWKRSKDPMALNMVERTLQSMRLGGIYDHVGYGFHRYSTDNDWLVPHFEKMLYDQALLAMAYLETHQATGNPIYADTAREVFTYVLRDMTSPEGGFFSAEDADSEGVEGKFYVWEESEIREILEGETADLFIQVMNVEPGGNFKDEVRGRRTGANILHLRSNMPELAVSMDRPEPELARRIESARERLFEAREKRVHPHKDDKILTDWNGLMIAALAKGAQVLGEPSYAETADRAVQFIQEHLRRGDKRLLHRYRDGEAGITAHLDDYAFVVWGLVELYEATFEPRYLDMALTWTDEMLMHHWDDDEGGLFFAADDAADLIIRKKEVYDGAVPSGNSVALYNLLRLARLTGRTDLEERAEKIIRSFSEQVSQYPSGYTNFLSAVDFSEGPAYEVVIAGASAAEDTREMVRTLRSRFLPNHVAIFRPTEIEDPAIDRVVDFIRSYKSMDGKATAYVCLAQTCKAPTTDATELLEMME
jgi:hypothetical protein